MTPGRPRGRTGPLLDCRASVSGLGKTLERSRFRARYQLNRSLRNGASRRAFRAQAPELTAPQQAAVDALRGDGLAIVPFSQLIGDDALWAQLAAGVRSFVAAAEEHIRAHGGRFMGKDDFIVRRRALMGAVPPPEALRYALSDQLLGVVNAYLGLRSKLTYVDNWYTAPSPPDADRIASQRWHRDHIDRNIVKVFTYFSDVDADAGATEYVRGSAAGGRHGDLWAWRPDDESADHYPPPEEFERRVPESDRVAAEGPTGTVVLCDTGGFHRGGFARKPRVTANFTYVSPAALASDLTKRRFELPDALPDPPSPAARFALE
jgi:Phytanoyl-CoA dioxygenase (PhyH)